MEDVPMALTRGQQVAGYGVEALIGEQAMSTVYRVRHLTFGTVHALKALQPKYAEIPAIRKEWLNQMRQLSAVEHPHLVSVVEVIHQPKITAIILDWMEGETLQTHMRRTGGVDIETAIDWVGQILDALAVIHHKELCHLEINPANIYLEKNSEGDKIAVVMDYGIGRRVVSERVQPAFSPHSIYYLSPELATNPTQVGPRSDIYSVGLLLYEMLSGDCPFKGDTEYNIINAIVNNELKPVHQQHRSRPNHIRRASSTISQVIAQAMKKDVGERYTTVEMFTSALEQAIGRALLIDEKGPFRSQVGTPDSFSEQFERMSQLGESPGTKTQYKNQFDQEVADIFLGPESNSSLTSISRNKPQNGKTSALQSATANLFSPKSLNDMLYTDMTLANARRDILAFTHSSSFNRWIILGVLVLFMVVGVYWNYLRGRDVILHLHDKPGWGRIHMEMDGKPFTRLKFPLMEFGNHQVQVRGGIFEGKQCTRCCWKRETTMDIKIGLGVQVVPIVFSDARGEQPFCPSENIAYAFSLIPPGRFLMGAPHRKPTKEG